MSTRCLDRSRDMSISGVNAPLAVLANETHTIALFTLAIRAVTMTNLHHKSLVRSHYKVAEAIRQRFVYHFGGSFLFTCSKNLPSITKDAQRWSKETRFAKIWIAVWTPKSQSSRERWCHNHESHCVNRAYLCYRGNPSYQFPYCWHELKFWRNQITFGTNI